MTDHTQTPDDQSSCVTQRDAVVGPNPELAKARSPGDFCPPPKVNRLPSRQPRRARVHRAGCAVVLT